MRPSSSAASAGLEPEAAYTVDTRRHALSTERASFPTLRVINDPSGGHGTVTGLKYRAYPLLLVAVGVCAAIGAAFRAT